MGRKSTVNATAAKQALRPAEFDQAIADEICERLAQGQSLRKICGADRDDFIPGQTTVYRWLDENDAFAKQYASARVRQADHYFDEIVEIADAPNAGIDENGQAVLRDPQRDRLRVEARKWVASKLAPKKYGEKLALVGGGDGDNPIATRVDVSNLSPEQLRALASVRLPSDA